MFYALRKNFVIFILILVLVENALAFGTVLKSCARNSSSTVALRIGNIFDGIGRFFSSENNDDHHDDDDLGHTTRLVSLKVSAIKPGGLRLFLMFYLLGVQNSPEKGMWKVDQPTSDEYIVNVFFHDKTAALIVLLGRDYVTIDRLGSTPSMAYILQETVIVDGILQELQKIATDVDIKRDDRLILLEDESAIVVAREALSFG